jgi:pteridine reductase
MTEAGYHIAGKTALITGAAKRIGKAIAITLAAEGVNVIVHYNQSDQEALDLEIELAKFGVKSWIISADFKSPDEYETLIDRAIELAGSLDFLVNSASIFTPSSFDELSFADLMVNFEVNAWVPFVLGRKFASICGKGKIVNLLDTRIEGFDWNHLGYILSKDLLASMTKMSALKFAPSITVNAIAPGLILPPPGEDMAYLQKLSGNLPLRRHGDPQDVADAVLFLFKSDFITGQVIYVDGGRHIRESSHGPYSY